MRIIAFPGGEESSPSEETWLAELDAALSDQAGGPAADSWRELRADVRSLAPPVSPEFMQSLERELARPSVDPVRPVRRLPWLRARRSSPGVAGAPRVLGAQRAIGRLRVLARPQLAGVVALVAALAVAVAVVGVGGTGAPGRSASVEPVAAGPSQSAPSVAGSQAAPSKGVTEPNRVDDLGPAAGPYSSSAGAASAAAAAAGRVQQLAASVSLSASPASVQTVSDGVSQLAVRDEGFVESSHVQVQQHGSSEATLTLRLPSAKLSAAIAALGRLAPVRAESQSLQDITSEYDAARQRLADANGERSALLLAIAKAPTQEKVEVLRARLAQTGREIVRARAALAAETRRASTAEVGVTVLGDMRASSEGLTLHRGLHDAGRILLGTAVVLLIAAAVLVPLGLLIAALLAGQGALRRRRRERVLEGP